MCIGGDLWIVALITTVGIIFSLGGLLSMAVCADETNLYS